MATLNVEHLEKSGPSPKSDLPATIGVRDKDRGLAVFKLRGSGQTRMGGPITQIYYLESHDKESVIRTFLEHNPGFVEEKTTKGFHRMMRAHGTSWGDAARKVTSEFFEPDSYPSPSGWSPEEQECPLCNTAFYGALATHLEADCEH